MDKDKMTKETMIVASIIEAETNLINEMDTISSVYNNRIDQKIKLESVFLLNHDYLM